MWCWPWVLLVMRLGTDWECSPLWLTVVPLIGSRYVNTCLFVCTMTYTLFVCTMTYTQTNTYKCTHGHMHTVIYSVDCRHGHKMHWRWWPTSFWRMLSWRENLTNSVSQCVSTSIRVSELSLKSTPCVPWLANHIYTSGSMQSYAVTIMSHQPPILNWF